MRRVLLTIVFLMIVVSIASANSPYKLAAWSQEWRDSEIPIQPLVLDPRSFRQQAPMFATNEVLAFAAKYRGHRYIVGDEPDASCAWKPYVHIPPSTYATYFHSFVDAVSKVDPTATFTASFGFVDVCPDHASTQYAESFYAAYQAAYGVVPEISEWRFHWFLTPGMRVNDWIASVDGLASWAVNHGAPMVIGSFALREFPQPLPPESWTQYAVEAMLNKIETDPRIVQAVWWTYEAMESGQYYSLLEPNGSLGVVGRIFKAHVSSRASTDESGASALPSFNDDKRADFADHFVTGGHFWVHMADAGGNTFEGASTLEGPVVASSGWDVLIGDFTGDGRADFADYERGTGTFWIHRNLGYTDYTPGLPPSSFTREPWCFGYSRTAGADWELLVGDFDGDGDADVLERNLKSGMLWVRLNNCVPNSNVDGFATLANGGVSVGRSMVGPEWRTVVADFVPQSYGQVDKRADIADVYVPAGYFWVHRNSTLRDGSGVSFGGGNAGEGGGTHSGSSWHLLFGDFNGDDIADYADLEVATGGFLIRLGTANANSRFSSSYGSTVWGQGFGYLYPGQLWRILGAW